MADQKTLEAIQKRLQYLEDKDALTALLNRYCTTADDKEWDEYAQNYLEDGTMGFEAWPLVRGRQAIEKAAAAEEHFQGVLHSMSNMQFKIDGDKASGRANLWYCATPDTSKPDAHYAFGGPYRFTFERTADGWKVATMHLRKFWAQGKDEDGVFG